VLIKRWYVVLKLAILWYGVSTCYIVIVEEKLCLPSLYELVQIRHYMPSQVVIIDLNHTIRVL